MRTIRTPHLVMPTAVLAALLLAGCGGEEAPAGSSGADASASAEAGSSGESAAPRTPADVDFAAGMIPHHGQAIEMADLALAKAGNAEVKDLAQQVKAGQQPEIDTLSKLLTAWDEPVPAATGHSGSMPGMDHGGSGMMTAEQMSQMQDASGAEFDRMWVGMMLAHHQGAVRMAEDVLRNGGNDEAKQLAQAIIDAQTEEIAELQTLRTELG
jgi:uncharacterized protein (DUF305 family)